MNVGLLHYHRAISTLRRGFEEKQYVLFFVNVHSSSTPSGTSRDEGLVRQRRKEKLFPCVLNLEPMQPLNICLLIDLNLSYFLFRCVCMHINYACTDAYSTHLFQCINLPTYLYAYLPYHLPIPTHLNIYSNRSIYPSIYIHLPVPLYLSPCV